MRYLGLIDQEGNRTPEAIRVFSLHDKDTFAKEFGGKVAEAYRDLFELHGEDTWDLDVDSLVTFFRSSDGTTDRVGKLQASTFRVLASFAGHGEVAEKPPAKQVSTTPRTRAGKGKTVPLAARTEAQLSGTTDTDKKRDVGLTGRIEINLPAEGTQETYDRIFRSIRENLLDG